VVSVVVAAAAALISIMTLWDFMTFQQMLEQQLHIIPEQLPASGWTFNHTASVSQE
jgi:hypothetical protein